MTEVVHESIIRSEYESMKSTIDSIRNLILDYQLCDENAIPASNVIDKVDRILNGDYDPLDLALG